MNSKATLVARLASLASLLATVSAHGQITSPTPRLPGSAMEAACGQQVYDNQASNDNGNIQNMLQVAASQTDYNAAECDVWLCKGYKFADNTANVQTYTAGQVVPITVDIQAPHTGTCNVSVVSTATNTMISDILIYFPVYASNSETIPPNNTQFSVTMPTNLGDQCATAGDCVLQWYWNAASIDQTYEGCIDFTMGGSGAAASAPAPSASGSLAVVSSALPPTTVATQVASPSAGSSTSVVGAAAEEISSSTGSACTQFVTVTVTGG